jgi:hypothetical protein
MHLMEYAKFLKDQIIPKQTFQSLFSLKCDLKKI